MSKLAQIWRHPIKSHGREALQRVALEVGKTMPWDRTWAVAHEGARISGKDWVPCANFIRVAKVLDLAAIEADLDEATEQVTLRHPDRPTLTLHPERDGAQLVDWVSGLIPQSRASASHVVRVPERGMTDSDFPSISIAGLASNAAVGAQLGMELSPIRWRANLWIEGLSPWEELGWIGKTVTIGAVELEVREQITRCRATTSNPETGQGDADTLGVLKSLGHQEFGVYAVVKKASEIAVGDPVTVQ